MELANTTCINTPTDSSMIMSIKFVFGYVNAFSTGIVLIIATMSWILIPKWRSYSNFIFSNLFLADFLLYLCFIDKYSDANMYSDYFQKSMHLFGRYVSFVYFCWLFVFSINIYMDSVHFKTNVTRKFMKASAFAWGLPLILHITLLILSVSTHHKKHKSCYNPHRHHRLHSSLIIKLVLEIILLAVNLFAYLVVTIILFKQRDRGTSSECNKIIIVTRTFFVCVVLWLLSVVLEASVSKFNRNDVSDLYNTCFIMHCTQMTYLKLYFLLSKSNGKRWRKYFTKMFRGLNREALQMIVLE